MRWIIGIDGMSKWEEEGRLGEEGGESGAEGSSKGMKGW